MIVYDAQAPQSLGLLTVLNIVMKRVLSSLMWYSRLAIAIFCWLIWVPFVTCLTYRLYLQKSFQLDALESKELSFYNYLNSNQLANRFVLGIVKYAEELIDFKNAFKYFFTLVFEGQIIASVVVVFGLSLLLLREYVIARVRDLPEPRRRNPAMMRDQIRRNQRRLFENRDPINELNANIGMQNNDNSTQVNHEENEHPVQIQENDTAIHSGADISEIIPPSEIPTTQHKHSYNLRSKSRVTALESKESDSKGKAVEEPLEYTEAAPSFSKTLPDISTGHNVIHSSNNALPANEPSAESSSEAGEWEDEDEPQNIQNVNEPLQEELDEGMQPVNMVLNVDIGDGEIVAQLEVNDFQAFLDLVGVNGSIWKLFQNVLLIHLLSFIALGVGVWVPYSIGKFTNYILSSFVVPTIIQGAYLVFDLLQKLSDPITEPIADFILRLYSYTMANISPNNHNGAKEAPVVDTVVKVLEVLSSPETPSIQFGPYDSNFFASFHQDMSFVMLGYIVMTILGLLYAV
jgi:hypothetical protein